MHQQCELKPCVVYTRPFSSERNWWQLPVGCLFNDTTGLLLCRVILKGYNTLGCGFRPLCILKFAFSLNWISILSQAAKMLSASDNWFTSLFSSRTEYLNFFHAGLKMTVGKTIGKERETMIENTRESTVTERGLDGRRTNGEGRKNTLRKRRCSEGKRNMWKRREERELSWQTM